MTGKTLDDIDARRISLGTLAGQLSGFIGGGDDVKNAILHGLHSNVNQLEKLLKTSCGDGKCDGHNNVYVLQKSLTEIKQKCITYDALQTQIAQKLAENKNSHDSDSDAVVLRQLKAKLPELEKEIFQQSSDLKTQITNVIDAVQKKISELQLKKNDVVEAQRQVNELKKRIDAAKNNEDLKKKLKDAEKELQKAKNNFPEKDAKSLDSHQASMKSLNSLQTLCQHCNEVNTVKHNNPHDLLDKLCSGLQTFLGYNSDSKGYDGSGIVYSDLDRLCDGVMSFLHGVLESVKEDESVITYNNYIKLTDNNYDLHNVLQLLTSSIGSGRVGLSVSVTKVKVWLGEYNEEVGNKTGAVTDGLSTLIGKLHDGSHGSVGDYYKEVAGRSGQELQEQLREWKETIGKIQHTVDTIDINVDKLDPNLRDKLRSEMNAIGGAVRMLNKSAWDKALERQLKAVDMYLNEERKGVEKTLHKWFNEIGKVINALRGIKKDKLDNIKAFLRDAQQFWGKFDNDYREIIQGYFNKISSAMTELDPNNTYAGALNDESKMKRDANKITEELKLVGDQLQGYVTNLQNWIEGAKGVRERAAGQCNEIIQRVEVKDNIYDTPVILKNSVDLYKAAFKLLEAYRDSYSGLDGLSKKITRALDGLEKVYKEKIEGVATKVHTDVEKALQQLTGLKDDVSGVIENAVRGQLIRELQQYLQSYNNPQRGASNSDGRMLGAAVSQAVYNVTAKFDSLFSSFNDKIKLNGTLYNEIEKVRKFEDWLEKPAGATTGGTKYTVKTDNITEYKNGGKGKKELLDDAIKKVKAEALTDFNGCVDNGNNGQVIEKKKELSGFFSTIITQLKDIANFVDKNKGNNKVGTQKDGVLDELNTLEKGLQTTPLGQSNNGLTQIKDAIDSIKQEEMSGKVGRIQKAIKAVMDIVAKLEKVPLDVKTFRENTETLMSRLKTEIKNRVDYIIYIVEKADEDLDTGINATHEILIEAQREGHKAVREAFDTVTSTIKISFADQKLADLSALHKLVERQAKKIKDIIDADITNGVKGFMGKMHEILPTLDAVEKQRTFTDFAQRLQWYLSPLLSYTAEQVKAPSKGKREKVESEGSKKVAEIQKAVEKLLLHLQKEKLYNFDYAFQQKLSALTDAVNSLSAEKFAGHQNPELLDALKKGMLGVTGELKHAYVNAYDGRKWIDYAGDENKLSKVLLTLMEGLRKDLFDLQNECKPDGKNRWHEKKICLTEEDKTKKQSPNPLGQWFKRRGFEVSDYGKQNGELRNHDECKGTQINEKYLSKNLNGASQIGFLTKWKGEMIAQKFQFSNQTAGEITLTDFVDILRDVFRKYYDVCQHIHIDSPKAPSNIYQMMCWLSGLRFNPMYEKLKSHFTKMLEDMKEESKLQKAELPVTYLDRKHNTINSHLNASHLNTSFGQVCLRSQLALVDILGHGHEGGRYACDFRTNLDKLNYPSNPSACLDMLIDILKRVLYQFRFLYSQCQNGTSRGGWADCSYGRYVGGSSWLCKAEQCANQDCDLRPNQNTHQSANQNGNQLVTQTCDQHPTCGVKSPLQSYLEDGLQGFLPHTITSPGCKLTCTVRDHFGKPCLTPMGFTDIATTASHINKGGHLKEALREFCGPESHLNKLRSMFDCLLRRPPQNLGEIFGFFQGYLTDWSGKGAAHKQTAFNAAVTGANFGQQYIELNPATLFVSGDHKIGKHENGDLFSIMNCNSDSKDTCGHYLDSLSFDVCNMYSSRNKSTYLSWIVYITETFYDLLKKLYEECCNNCTKAGTRCHNKRCAVKCPVKAAYESQKSSATDKQPPKIGNQQHKSDCTSIIKCPHSLPTLTKYGFSFWSAYKLSGDNGMGKKRSCKDFCNALEKVIGEGCALVELRTQIDNFIWKIREKFSYLLLALWSLSLLYLLHIAVVRLDVLRIRSHLRSPSSHRIAAQSLLAAARVKALANVKYFSP
ncbi:hypothetical protein, conserved [Babesia ovata]|uniref:C3H1-type domain-containing protein n=1 Tax=Babesia ovata TaxID=189622 RepID=A0A2H6KAH9_9APIC|nr:uncharacterized protein BOVATA_014520 [Babesia ovata]GBE59959.1 hypothetical protein, conserved [Babesia ovata]